MKTAMQELIEMAKRNIKQMPNEKNLFTQGYKAGLSFLIECANNSLEKEKEQIKNAWCEGINDGDPEKDPLYKDFQDYYNQTYKQNK